MKKVICIFAIIATTLSFTSCDDDDEPKQEEIIEQDQLIGKWKIIEILVDDIKTDLGCDGESVFEVAADGTFTDQTHEDLGDGAGCTLMGSTTGTWVNNGNNSYTLTYGDDDLENRNITFTKDTYSFVDEFENNYKYVYQRQ